MHLEIEKVWVWERGTCAVMPFLPVEKKKKDKAKLSAPELFLQYLLETFGHSRDQENYICSEALCVTRMKY